MFASDNNSGVHPKILEAIVECNKDHDFPYGEDMYTKKAVQRFKEVFGQGVDVYFTVNGTGANIIGLSSMLRPFEGVVCAETAHINVDECGAFERFIGAKILQIPHKNGKINVEDIKTTLHARGNEHHTQPKVITISQVTELGTIYTVDEIKELATFAHEHDLLLHVDGSRISNAAQALGVSFKEMIADTGVDLLSFGGTKNGMMYGEAIISLNPSLSKSLKYIRKQGMQLMSKMRYISAQFLAFLEDDLWKENAQQANDTAQRLLDKIQGIAEIEVIEPVDANILFVKLPKEWIKPLQEKNYFYVIDEETDVVRWVTSYDTTKQEVMDFVNEIKKLQDLK
jgi:threonine aldolase